MLYLPPFDVVKASLKWKSSNGRLTATITDEELRSVIKLLLRAVPVDEDWYLRLYPDVAQAIQAGEFRSARHHFVDEGYLEGRLPFPHQINEEWYTQHYEDVLEGIELGDVGSACEHFVQHGYREGRFPSDY